MIVYRVQDRNGRGPWKPGFSESWVEDRTEQEFDAIAPPSMDIMLAIMMHKKNPHLGYGCASLLALRLWFKKREYETLVRLGYRAVEMQVDDVIWEGPNQVAFSRAKPLHSGGKVFNLYP